MAKPDQHTKALAAAHIKFALALHYAYSAIGAPVRPIKLKSGSKSRRETLLKQIKRLQDKLEPQRYLDCPTFAKKFNSIYLRENWAEKADKAVQALSFNCRNGTAHGPSRHSIFPWARPHCYAVQRRIWRLRRGQEGAEV